MIHWTRRRRRRHFAPDTPTGLLIYSIVNISWTVRHSRYTRFVYSFYGGGGLGGEGSSETPVSGKRGDEKVPLPSRARWGFPKGTPFLGGGTVSRLAGGEGVWGRVEVAGVGGWRQRDIHWDSEQVEAVRGSERLPRGRRGDARPPGPSTSDLRGGVSRGSGPGVRRPRWVTGRRLSRRLRRMFSDLRVSRGPHCFPSLPPSFPHCGFPDDQTSSISLSKSGPCH